MSHVAGKFHCNPNFLFDEDVSAFQQPDVVPVTYTQYTRQPDNEGLRACRWVDSICLSIDLTQSMNVILSTQNALLVWPHEYM